MCDDTFTATPAQRHTAEVLSELAERIDASLVRVIAHVEPEPDGSPAIQGFLRELGQVVSQLTERFNVLGRAGGPLSGPGGDISGLPALLGGIERQTWYLIGLVESFLSKRFASPHSALQPYVAALGEKVLTRVRDLFHQYVEVVRDPLAHANAGPTTGQVKVSLHDAGCGCRSS